MLFSESLEHRGTGESFSVGRRIDYRRWQESRWEWSILADDETHGRRRSREQTDWAYNKSEGTNSK